MKTSGLLVQNFCINAINGLFIRSATLTKYSIDYYKLMFIDN